MTNYQRLRINGPREAFDEIAEEVYVEERSRDQLVVLLELGGDTRPDNRVKEIIREEVGSLKDYDCNGGRIDHQEDLPEELRNTEKFEKEQDNLTPNNDDWEDSEIISTLTVLQAVREHEKTNAGNRDIINDAKSRLKEIYGEDLEHNYTNPEDISEEEVMTALDLLQSEGAEKRGKDEYNHPNNSLAESLDYVKQRIKHSEDFLFDLEA